LNLDAGAFLIAQANVYLWFKPRLKQTKYVHLLISKEAFPLRHKQQPPILKYGPHSVLLLTSMKAKQMERLTTVLCDRNKTFLNELLDYARRDLLIRERHTKAVRKAERVEPIESESELLECVH
jgi:hypothetical protein